MSETIQPCRICRKPFHSHPMGNVEGYDLVACNACGSVMIDPWMTQEELDQYFGDVQPEIVHLPDPVGEIEKNKKIIMKLMPQAHGNRFLDVSCCQGYAVMAAKALGLQARGIDSHGFFIAFAKDKHDPALFEHATLKSHADAGMQADIVFSTESLSEQIDPDAYVADLARVLAPKGVLYMYEADGNSYWLPRKFTSWQFVNPPLNFSYLSRKGLEALLARHGLKIQQSIFVWGPYMRLVITKK